MQLIKYLGNRKTDEGQTVYVFAINGRQTEVKESDFKKHPGCFEALPASVKEKIIQHRKWIMSL